MTQQSFEKFFAERQRAAAAYVNGDGAAVDALIPHDGEASFHSPGGDSVSGAAKVARRYSEDAKIFEPNSESRFEVLQMEAGLLDRLPGRQCAHEGQGRADRDAHPRY